MRCFVVVAGCCLLLAAAAKADAAGGLQLGPTLIYPALSATATYDDNINQASDNQESGWVTSVAPSLRVALPVRRFYLNVEGGLNFLSYYDADQKDSTDWHVGAAIGADFPGGLSFRIADKQSQRYLIKTQEYGVGENNAVNTLSVTLAYALRSLRLELAGDRTAAAFDASKRRERAETTLGATLYWKFRPAISALLQGTYGTYAYDSNTAQDSSATQVSLGLTWDLTARSTGFVKAGYQWKRFDTEEASLGTENTSYYTLGAGLRHNFTARTALGLNLSRASLESDFPENPYFVRTAVDVNLAQRLTAKLYARLGARYGRDEYPHTTSYDNPFDVGIGVESGDRTDTTLGGNVALGFDVARWLSFEAGFAAESRDSSFDTFDFDETQVSLNAKAAF
jgi:hypothetical protein